jgi:hypothetical protein
VNRAYSNRHMEIVRMLKRKIPWHRRLFF